MSATTPCLLNSADRSRPESVGPAQETLYRKAIALAEERYEDCPKRGHAMSSECTACTGRAVRCFGWFTDAQNVWICMPVSLISFRPTAAPNGGSMCGPSGD
jgi:hypothetical protein